MGQAFTVLLAAHLVKQVQGEHAEYRYHDQCCAHPAVDSQEDRVHRVQASGTNR